MAPSDDFKVSLPLSKVMEVNGLQTANVYTQIQDVKEQWKQIFTRHGIPMQSLLLSWTEAYLSPRLVEAPRLWLHGGNIHQRSVADCESPSDA